MRVCAHVWRGRVSVVGCNPTTWLQPRAPQELKVECSVLDASVPPTGVRPSGSIQYTHTHTSGQSERACCAPWRSTSSPPIRRSHHCTAVHEHPQLHCTTFKLRSLPLLSQLCAVQRASSAVPASSA